MFFDLLLGLGMLLVVLDESRIHTRRLATLNALTTSIARAGEYGPMTATALQKLKELMDADAAWFRLVDGRRLTIFQHIGLSPEFLRQSHFDSCRRSPGADSERASPHWS